MEDVKSSFMPAKMRFDVETYATKGYSIAKKKKEEINRQLDGYRFPKNADDVDLSEVIKDWFPSDSCDIFLSHSHNDEKFAIALSRYLQEIFGLKCFIDSCTWGYVETLLEKIDDNYCKDGDTYDYEKRNGTTAHVHIMLNSALMKMMKSSRSFVFIQTDNSLQTNRKGVNNWTYSSWIYSELSMSRVMYDMIHPEREAKSTVGRKILLESAKLPMGYSDVMVDHLKKISLSDLQTACKEISDVDARFNFLHTK